MRPAKSKTGSAWENTAYIFYPYDFDQFIPFPLDHTPPSKTFQCWGFYLLNQQSRPNINVLPIQYNISLFSWKTLFYKKELFNLT